MKICETCKKLFVPKRKSRIFCSASCRSKKHHCPTTPIEQRFFRYVEKSPTCWLWTASTCQGYGQINKRENGKTIKVFAHRLSYEIHKGKIPKGLFVCHTCDVKLCVNPSHLWLGSCLENIRDAKKKGRTACGERSGPSVLSAAQVLQIRHYHSIGTTQTELAHAFSVTRNAIKSIITRRSWAHI